MNKNPNVIYNSDTVKGVYIKHSVTKLNNESQFKKKYGYTLQEVNDRICSYKPNVEYPFKDWDHKSWDLGLYQNKLDSNPGSDVNLWLWNDFHILVTSAACMRGYQNPTRVRGGTREDVDDFFNFCVLKLLERRLKQFDWTSPCRVLDNWPSYIARVIPQYLICYNKNKFDYEVETFWPLVKDENTGEWVQKEFGVDMELNKTLFSLKDFYRVFNKALREIPESRGFEADVLMYILYGTSFSNKKLVSIITDIVKLKIMEMKEELI